MESPNMTTFIDEVRHGLRAEGWLCLESGGSRQTVTIIARRGPATISEVAPTREAAWEKLSARIPPIDGLDAAR
jgi:hypothetical protein